ncbi:uncharacterized protein cd34 [Cetorhinus maximus]
MWSLVNISKGHQFSLMLCALCLIAQWSCHSSAQAIDTTPTVAAAKNNNTQSGVPSTIKSTLNNSEDLSTLAENLTIQSRTDNLISTTSGRINPESEISHLETTSLPAKVNGANVPKSEMQDGKIYSKAGPPKVLIALLVCGLCLAAIILAVHYWMNKRTWSPQTKRLDEEPDAQDHDSTMFSPTSEDQSDAHEKPKLNGETQENGENQRAGAGAATGNGHQRKKAEEADTEL